MNVAYSPEQTNWIRQMAQTLNDRELTASYNEAFGVNVRLDSLRKKRQRLGIIKTALSVRMQYCQKMGMTQEEMEESIRVNPPVDMCRELKLLRSVGPLDIQAR